MFVEGKVAIITGGASGIGYQFALQLFRNGLKGVTLADVDPKNGAVAVENISKEFGEGKVHFVKADASDYSQFENAFKETVDKFGQIDILINNAGIMNEKIWEKQIAINVNGPIYGCLLAMDNYMPKYKSGNEGLIINIASIAAFQEFPSVPFYAATKSAVVGLTRSLGTTEQYETCPVRLVCICPGVSDTPLMQNLDQKCPNQRYVDVMIKCLNTKCPPMQTPEETAAGLMKVIEEGENGSIWVAECGETYEVELPTREQMRKKK